MSVFRQTTALGLLLMCFHCQLMAANGQRTIGSEEYGERNEHNMETRLSMFMQQMEAMVGSLNNRFDRLEDGLNSLKHDQDNLKHGGHNMSEELTCQEMTSQRNHVDQLNEIETVLRVVEAKIEDVQKCCVISNNSCPLLVIANADVTPTYLGYVIVSCRHGYFSNNMQSWIIAECHDNTWVPMPTDCTPPRRDCSDLRALGFTTSGVYTVYVGDNLRPLAVYCDMTTESGGWTVFQRRQDGSVDFYRNWADYQHGFGDVSGEFWIGNDNLHLLTAGKRYKLRVELTAFDGSTGYAEFDNFKVASAADKYRLSSIGTYSGTAGDSLSYQVGQQFSTFDQDNDLHESNCAMRNRGAWWFNACMYSCLNGRYYKTLTISGDGLFWHHLKYTDESMKRSEMKITPLI